MDGKSHVVSKRKQEFDWLFAMAGNLGCLPFTWENRKFPLENQMVRAIPFEKLRKIWAVI